MSALWHTREVNEVVWASPTTDIPQFARKKRRLSGRRGKGIKYEIEVQRYLQELYGSQYFSSPWMRYREYEHEMLRFCQPDGILLDVESGIITLVEVKYQHTYEAYRQLFLCYRQVVQQIFPPSLWGYRYLEVVKWYDPQVAVPIETQLCRLPHFVREGVMGIHIWS